MAVESTLSSAIGELAAAQAALAKERAENEALRAELSAFDIDFWSEIEELKYRYQQTTQMLQQAQVRCYCLSKAQHNAPGSRCQTLHCSVRSARKRKPSHG